MESKPKIATSNIVTAFSPETIGTRVEDPVHFMTALALAVSWHDESADRVPGQHYIDMPEAIPFVSAGVGRHTIHPEDYVCREHRGQVGVYLRREHAAPVEGLAAIVYRADAYLADPEVSAEEEARILDLGSTHVLVAVLASAGPRSPLTPHRFVQNLAGGNKEAMLWSGDEIRTKAAEIAEYYNTWGVVAD